ncbi:MAG: sulfite exporter TauE/SafE family protein [Novosphingobium sp.]
MSLLAHFDVLHALAGLLVGILVGMTGVGGGSLMTPLLVLMFGISAQTAVGTDLLYAASTKLVGAGVHGWRATVEWKIVRRLAAGSIPAACATLVVLSHFGRINKSAEHVILLILGGMLVLTGCAVFFQRRLIAMALAREPLKPGTAGASTIVLGAVIGLLVSISSVGAGAIGVTALLMLYPKLPISRIVGTDIAHAVPLALVSGLGHWLLGDVNLVLLGNLLIGSIPGVIVGSLISTRAPDRLLRPALALVMLASGIKLLT